MERVVQETLVRVIAMGGTIAAEHGIGKLKRRWLPLQMSPLQIGLMRSIKHELDPHGVLAPGNVPVSAALLITRFCIEWCSMSIRR